MDEMTLTLNSPITEEQWDAITDVDFDHTDKIWFHTKHGKDVEFVKQRKGKWILRETENDRYDDMICPFCKTCYTVDAYRIDDIEKAANEDRISKHKGRSRAQS